MVCIPVMERVVEPGFADVVTTPCHTPSVDAESQNFWEINRIRQG